MHDRQFSRLLLLTASMGDAIAEGASRHRHALRRGHAQPPRRRARRYGIDTFDLRGAVGSIDPNEPFRIVSTARPGGEYLWNEYLPEVNRPDFNVKSGGLIIRATMAGMSGMDSPYPPSGASSLEKFSERVTKVSSTSGLTEEQTIELYENLKNLVVAGQPTRAYIVDVALNLVNYVVLQGHLDTFEYLRGQALTTGKLNWRFARLHLDVDYELPAERLLPIRTGTDRYGGSTSMFWADVRTLRRLLDYNERAFVVNPLLADQIIDNPANNIAVVAREVVNRFVVRFRLRKVNAQGNFTQDVGDVVELLSYSGQGEIFDLATPGATLQVPFCPAGALSAIGNNAGSVQLLNVGSQASPTITNAIGETHIGPTAEGNLRPGRWSQVYVPQHQAYRIEAQGVTNGLPVFSNLRRLAVARTAMA